MTSKTKSILYFSAAALLLGILITPKVNKAINKKKN